MTTCAKSEETFIGILDGPITKSHVVNWMVNKVGGNPILDLKERTGEVKFSCKFCGKLLALVVQINCPLSNCNYHRLLLAYACISQKCWNNSESWKVIRRQIPAEIENQRKRTESSFSSGTHKWLDVQDDWEDEANEASNETKSYPFKSSSWNFEMTECSLETANLSLSERGDSRSDSSFDLNQSLEKSITEEIENDDIEVCRGSIDEKNLPDWLSENSQLTNIDAEIQPIFCEYFIAVINEPAIFVQGIENERINDLIKEYDLIDKEATNKSSEKKQREGYESASVKHGDKIFYKFLKKLSLCPDQVIRYSWMSSPLWIKAPIDQEGLPNCEYCGARRVFEFQLMPPLVNFLNLTNVDFEIRPLEFGVAIISSCEKSCWKDTDLFREEHVYVQSDPDEEKFTKFMSQ